MAGILRKPLIACAGLYSIMKVAAKLRTEPKDLNDDNPYFNSVDGHKDGDEHGKVGLYESTVKPIFDQILSFGGLLVFSPVYAVAAILIYMDDPGPVFFTQKRIGKDKRFFFCHKFRSMRMSAPANVPTHMLANPEDYITRVGKVLRKTSLDELPQIWDIFRNKMSVIGPRPALWNQDDLVAEREKYNANSIFPGLTGLAQICGRDELEITDKARIDGEYTSTLRVGGLRAMVQDIKCFLGTVKSVLKHDGVVEGGTGGMKRRGSV